MPGERDLSRLLSEMRPRLEAGSYVFVSVAALDAALVEAAIVIAREDEGVTCVVPEVYAESRGLVSAFPCRRITLRVHSALDAVGLLNEVTRVLARSGISVNIVSACHHDVLFVAVDRADDAMRELHALADGG